MCQGQTKRRNNWRVIWIEFDKWLWRLGICRSDVWLNLLFVKGNSTEGGETGSGTEKCSWRRVSMTLLCLLWTARGLLKCWRQWRMARLKPQRATVKIQRRAWHCRGRVYLPERPNLSLLSRLFWKTPSWHNAAKGSNVSLLSCWAGRKLAQYVLVGGSCGVWVCSWPPGRVSVEIESEIWREERAWS